MSGPSTNTASSGESIVALDIGGMSIRSGVVGPDHLVHSVQRTPIDHRAPAEGLLASIASSITNAQHSPGGRVAIAVPGPFDHEAGVSSMTHKFAALEGIDLRAALIERLGTLDIRFVNDAAAAGAGEVHAAGTPFGHTLVLTLGTGLGAALFDGANIVDVHDGIHIGELWATPIGDGRAADDRFSATGLAAALGVEPAELPTATETPEALGAVEAWGNELGRFIDSMQHRLDLERVILGGGASGAFETFGTAVAAATAVPVRQAALGSSGPLIGAVVLAFGTD